MQNSQIRSIFKQTKFKPSKWTTAFLLLSSMLILMGGAAVAPALPLISESFPDASEAVVSLIITLPSLAIAFSGFFIGILSDRKGRIPVLSASLLIFSFAGVSGFFLNSLSAILAGRIILGIGIAGITVTTSNLITDYYTGIARAKILGYQAASMGIGVLILETSGGILATISWRMSFLIYLLGIVILAGVLVTMREPLREPEPIQNAGSGRPVDKVENPIHVSGKKTGYTTPLFEIGLVYATLFLSMVMFFLLPTKLPYLIADIINTAWPVQAGGIFSNHALLSGLFLGLMGFVSALAGIFYWRITASMHRVSVLALSYILLCLGFVMMGLSGSLLPAGIAVIIIGAANGLIIPTLLSWLMSVTPRPIVGKVMGGWSVSLNTGQFCSSLAVVPVFAVVGSYAGLYASFGILAGLIGVFYLAQYLRMKFSSPGKPTVQRN